MNSTELVIGCGEGIRNEEDFGFIRMTGYGEG